MRIPLPKLAQWVMPPLRRATTSILSLLHRGTDRYCPVCGNSSSHFRPFGVVPREDAQCVHCGALERHRLVWLYFEECTDIFDSKPKNMLHLAPEPCFQSILKERLGNGYLTADLHDTRAMVQMDICDIPYPEGSFDVIYCSHVLEHVPDDKKGMRELYRVLKAGGWAIINVPISSDMTIEDPSIVDPKQRLVAFGQKDHVRRYGSDYVERLLESGFTVQVITVADVADRDEAVGMGLTPASGEIYYCTKSGSD